MLPTDIWGNVIVTENASYNPPYVGNWSLLVNLMNASQNLEQARYYTDERQFQNLLLSANRYLGYANNSPILLPFISDINQISQNANSHGLAIAQANLTLLLQRIQNLASQTFSIPNSLGTGIIYAYFDIYPAINGATGWWIPGTNSYYNWETNGFRAPGRWTAPATTTITLSMFGTIHFYNVSKGDCGMGFGGVDQIISFTSENEKFSHFFDFGSRLYNVTQGQDFTFGIYALKRSFFNAPQYWATGVYITIV